MTDAPKVQLLMPAILSSPYEFDRTLLLVGKEHDEMNDQEQKRVGMVSQLLKRRQPSLWVQVDANPRSPSASFNGPMNLS